METPLIHRDNGAPYQSKRGFGINPVKLVLSVFLGLLTFQLVLRHLSNCAFDSEGLNFLRVPFEQTHSSLPVRTEIPEVILNNGVLMPKIAAGTWQYKGKVAGDSVLKALRTGFNHIDTAYNYGNQKEVGRAIATFLSERDDMDRNDIFITTKIPGCGTSGVSFSDCGDDTRKAIENNLEELNVNHVDLLLVHFPPMGDGITGGCGQQNCNAMRHQWKALQHSFLKKHARSIGISNFCKECIDCIMSWGETTVLPSVNQIQFHIGMGPDPEELVSYSKSKGMVVQAYSPLGNKDDKLIKGEGFIEVADAHDKTAAQVALKWVLQNEVAVVTKSTNEKHMKSNLDIFDWDLTEQEMETLNQKHDPFSTPSFVCSDSNKLFWDDI